MFCSFLNRNLLKTLAVLSAIIGISLGIDMKCTIRRMVITAYSLSGNRSEVESLVITERNQIITSINGQTKSYYRSQNITGLWFEDQTMNFMPKGLEKFFPKIERISITRSKLKELTKEDLAPFPMLKNLWIRRNDLETLPSNLFEANPELNHVQFNNEKLKFVGENILSPLKKLKYADFSDNPCINMHAASKKEIPALIAELQDKCQQPQETKPEPQEPQEPQD
jgi:Leucine-rich repeat (LRR) protein